MNRLHPYIQAMATEFLSKTLEERLDEIAPKAVRESRRATCSHDQFDMIYMFCRNCGMTPHEHMSAPQRFN